MLLLGFNFRTLIVIGSIIPSCACLSRSTIQLDIIFPRNGSVYKPTWPFPIVFAVHNIDRVWSLQPGIAWDFSGPWKADGGDPRRTEEASWSHVLYPNSVREPTWTMKEPLPAPPQTFVIINGTRALHIPQGREKSFDSGPGRYRLQFELLFGNYYPVFGYVNDCMVIQKDARRLKAENNTRSTPFRMTKSIFFELSENGTLPDMLSGGTCSQALGTVSIPSLYMENGTAECPEYTVDPPRGENCLYRIDESFNKNVTKHMLDLLDCNETEYSWPNKTSNGLTCPEARHKAKSDAMKNKPMSNAASIIESLAWYNIALFVGAFGLACSSLQ
jgi:hypothetical protein